MRIQPMPALSILKPAYARTEYPGTQKIDSTVRAEDFEQFVHGDVSFFNKQLAVELQYAWTLCKR